MNTMELWRKQRDGNRRKPTDEELVREARALLKIIGEARASLPMVEDGTQFDDNGGG
jgi:hypothetical protein